MTEQLSELIAARLRQPYARLLIPEPDGTFRGEILEFPGCIATGDTPDEVLSALEEAARGWLEAALAHGQNIPEPVDGNEFSGRLVLRLPKSLHKKAARLAERDGVSLNQFITTSLAESVGERSKPISAIFVSTMTIPGSSSPYLVHGDAMLAFGTSSQTPNATLTQAIPVTLRPLLQTNLLLRTG